MDILHLAKSGNFTLKYYNTNHQKPHMQYELELPDVSFSDRPYNCWSVTARELYNYLAADNKSWYTFHTALIHGQDLQHTVPLVAGERPGEYHLFDVVEDKSRRLLVPRPRIYTLGSLVAGHADDCADIRTSHISGPIQSRLELKRTVLNEFGARRGFLGLESNYEGEFE